MHYEVHMPSIIVNNYSNNTHISLPTKAGIFDGDYGSEKENQLESTLDMMTEKKQRIAVAKYKWQNSRVLIQYAVNQLAFAVKKWTEVQNTPKE